MNFEEEPDYNLILKEVLGDFTNDEQKSEVENIQEQSLDTFEIHDYCIDTINVLNSQQSFSVENALKSNKELKQMLFQLKYKVEYLLQKCRKKYKQNEETIIFFNKLKRMTNNDEIIIKKIGRPRLGSYYTCGAPFFRDLSNFRAPYNEDYAQRKLRKELFPLDIDLIQHCWTVPDKVNVLQGIKSQAIKYLTVRKKINNEIKDLIAIKKSCTYSGIDIELKNFKKILEYVGDDFQINWFLISVEYLKGRHPENTCFTMWNMYLKPNLNRNKWTTDENDKLFKAASIYNFENWERIALEMNNRSEYQCFVQFRTELTHKVKLGNKWTDVEDQLLLKAVDKYRVGKTVRWNKVATHFPHKSKKQVYTRYRYSVDPCVDKRKFFTEEEDRLLVTLMKKYNNNFTRIPVSLFPGRTLLQIRNRYNNVLKYNEIQKVWTIDDDKKLLKLIEKYGTSHWNEISKEFDGYHTRTSCRTRYTVIKKYFDKNPNTNVEEIPRKPKRPLKFYKKFQKSKNHENNNEIYEIAENKIYRSIELKYQDILKLSYNFKFGLYNNCTTKDYDNLFMLITLFGINMKYDKIKDNSKKFHKIEYITIKSYKLNSLLKKNLQKICIIRSDFVLPPNWSTLIGLRGLCIQSLPQYNDFVMKKNYRNYSKQKDLIDIDIGKKRFFDRIFSTFYKTALLSQITLEIEAFCENNSDTISNVLSSFLNK